MSLTVIRHFLDDVESLIYARTHPINVPFVPAATSPSAVTRPELLASSAGGRDTPGEIALGLLDWLLDGDISRAEPLLQIAPPTWAHLLQAGGVPLATGLVASGLCHAAAAIEPALAPRVAVVDRASAVPAVLLARLERHAREAARGEPRPATAVQWFRSPNPEFLTSLVALVGEHVSAATPSPVDLSGLEPAAFLHPGDRFFLSKLTAFQPLESLVSLQLDLVARAIEIRLLGGAIEVTSSSLPELHDLFLNACRRLDFPPPYPPLFVEQGGVNAYTTGVDRPFVVVSSMLASCFDQDELLFVLGHELGHALAMHVKFHTLGEHLKNIARGLPALGGVAGAALDVTLVPVLHAWFRRSEYTADRAGLLACQSEEAALRALIKLAGFPLTSYAGLRTRPFLAQVDAFRRRVEGGPSLDALLDAIDHWAMTHPRLVMRASELLAWVADGSYHALVEASAQGRQAVARRQLRDPKEQELLQLSVQSLGAWYARERRLPRRAVLPPLRRAIFEQISPTQTAAGDLLGVDLVVIKQEADKILYEAVVLVRAGAEVKRVRLLLPFDATWDRCPDEFRGEFLRSGHGMLMRRLFLVT